MNIADLRKKHNMSQKELAGKLGIDTSLLSRMENGSRPVNKEMLAKLREIFAEFTENMQVEDEFPQIEAGIECFSPRMRVAVEAMKGLAANFDTHGVDRPGYLDRFVKAAFAIADKMIEVGGEE